MAPTWPYGVLSRLDAPEYVHKLWTMKLLVNGEDQNISENSTISELLTHLGLTRPVAVERNGEVVPRANHTSTQLAENDRIEIVHFVGGG